MKGAIVFLILRFGYVHEYIAFLTGSSFYVLFLVSTLVAGAAILSGGLRRLLNERHGKWWCAFALWLGVTVPFSYWKYNSAKFFLAYIQVPLIVLLITGGLALTLKECYRLMYAVAFAAVVSVGSALMLGWQAEGRLGMRIGSMGNTNDIPAHLIYVLPFLVFFALRTKVKVFKLLGVVILLCGAMAYLRTGSRGGLVCLIVVAFYVFLVTPMWTRLLMLGAVPLALIVVLALLPKEIKERYATLPGVDASPSQAQDAVDSTITRRYLLETSFKYTLEHPIFGVGVGGFEVVEGGTATALGRHGLWQGTHNAYTQVSSETGIPGLFIYLGAIISTFHLLRSIKVRCGQQPQYREAAAAASCMMVSMVGFCVAITFLNLAYVFYLPGMTGFAMSLDRAVRYESAAAKYAEVT
ncbi:MAG: O-antigen ligase family protein [Acidobacteriales bacterium]|nr:O-antigen ligase family protein [Terriglobales bacterium]